MSEDQPTLSETLQAGEETLKNGNVFLKGIRHYGTTVMFAISIIGFIFEHFREPSVVGDQIEAHGQHQARQNWEQMKPLKVDMDTNFQAMRADMKINRYAISIMPGGSSALKKAFKQRSIDSTNGTRWTATINQGVYQ